jgi:hypothetical protein
MTSRPTTPSRPTTTPTGPSTPARPTAAGSAPRQRWRLTYRRDLESSRQAQRDWLTAWESGFAASGLPCVGLEAGGSGRPRIAHAAPLPAGIPGDRELADLLLADRLDARAVRTGILAALPPGHALVDLHDVWVGEPPLPGQVRAARYRAVLAGASPDSIRAAIQHLTDADSLTRSRVRGSGPVAFDLRPLIVGASVISDGPPVQADLVLRIDPALGTGRPADVVAALGDPASGGTAGIEASSMVRMEILLAGDPALD